MSCNDKCGNSCQNLKCEFSAYIEDLVSGCQDMSIYLVNGIRLDGKIIGYDENIKCIWICNTVNQNKPQVIFLSAVSTISFIRSTKFQNAEQAQ